MLLFYVDVEVNPKPLQKLAKTRFHALSCVWCVDFATRLDPCGFRGKGTDPVRVEFRLRIQGLGLMGFILGYLPGPSKV